MAKVAAPKPSQKWEVRDAVEVLKRAEQIKSDPKMMQQVRSHAAAESQALGKIARRGK
jgi:hypothetical protein